MCSVSGAPLCTALHGNHYERPSLSLSLQRSHLFYLWQVWSCQRRGLPSGLDWELSATAQRCKRALTSGADGRPACCSRHGTQGSCSRNHTHLQAGGAHWTPSLQPPPCREHTVQEHSVISILSVFCFCLPRILFDRNALCLAGWNCMVLMRGIVGLLPRSNFTQLI